MNIFENLFGKFKLNMFNKDSNNHIVINNNNNNFFGNSVSPEELKIILETQNNLIKEIQKQLSSKTETEKKPE